MVVPVPHTLGQYDVHIEAGLLATLPALLDRAMPARRRVVISDETVAREFGAPIRASAPVHLTIPPGEHSKTRSTWAPLSARGEAETWFLATWDFTKQITPLLFGGVLVAGFPWAGRGTKGSFPPTG